MRKYLHVINHLTYCRECIKWDSKMQNEVRVHPTCKASLNMQGFGLRYCVLYLKSSNQFMSIYWNIECSSFKIFIYFVRTISHSALFITDKSDRCRTNPAWTSLKKVKLTGKDFVFEILQSRDIERKCISCLWIKIK